MQKIVVTGGSGFIGTNLINGLTNGFAILNIDKAKPVINDHIKYWKQVDILDFEKLKEEIVRFAPEVIIHLAAVTDLEGGDLSYYDTNIKGTQNIIDIAAKLPSLKKIIFTSSMYVCKTGFIPTDYDTYLPHTVYGESKVEGEKLVKNIKNPHYEWIIIRPTSIWGPWFKYPYINFFDIVYQKKYFDFNKACTKTYGYIGNTVFQIRSLVNSTGTSGKTFYLGDMPPTQISEWANEISIEMKKGSIRKIPFFILKCAAFFGDLLSRVNINFPLNTFRLSNMTTDNVLPLNDIYNVSGTTPYLRIDGVRETLRWLKQHKGYNL